MRSKFLNLAILAVTALGQQNMQCQDPTCCFTSPSSTYDMSSFSAVNYPNGVVVNDGRNNTADPRVGFVYAYIFGLCGNINPPSTSFTPSTTCNSTKGDDGIVRSGPAPAFQVGENINACQALGSASVPGVFSPNRYNPAHGLSVTYNGGDSCILPNGTTVQRAITLDFHCANVRGFNPNAYYDIVMEDTTCHYHAFIYTRAACPIQCPAPFGAVCGNKGVCDYDATNEVSRCFCNSGVSGPSCQVVGDKGLPAPPSYGGNIFGAFVGGLLLGLAGVLGYYYYKAKKENLAFFEAIRLQLPFGSSGAGHVKLPDSDKGFYDAPTNTSVNTATSSWMDNTNTGYIPPIEA